ncbi:MAG: SHOCT domain-containing protein [Omnitrophica WOR_2 bacterium]
MMIFGLLIPILLIALIAYAFGWRPGNYRFPAQNFNQPSALDVLRTRYARGEITREQYEQMRNDLEER